ncbi:MAG: hypothetical protein M1813_009808 [Trichoglossum hirsutum]|nr:MAG: hypothetical protein M1813_009808 [Trichoglossum hirsutum]
MSAVVGPAFTTVSSSVTTEDRPAFTVGPSSGDSTGAGAVFSDLSITSSSTRTLTQSNTSDLFAPESSTFPAGLPRPSAPSTNPSPQKPVGAIVGGVIGGVAGLILVALVVLLLRRRKLLKGGIDDYGKSRSELTYRTTDMSSDSSPVTYQSRYGQPPKAYEAAPTGRSHAGYGLPTSAQEQPNYADRQSARREAAKVILSPTPTHPQDQAVSPVSPTRNELDSREVNEDGVSVRSPSPDVDTDGRFDSIRGPTPTPESQAVRSHVPRLPLISRTKGGQGPTI